MRINKFYKGGFITVVLSLLEEYSFLAALLLERQKEFAFEGKRGYDLLRLTFRNNFENQCYVLNLVDVKAGPFDYQKLLSYYSDS